LAQTEAPVADQLNGYWNFNASQSASSSSSIMKLLSALAQFSPHAEIDNWINAHPITSPIFNCRSDFLAQVTVGFAATGYLIHVPFLLPFCSDFDSSSPLNLYLVGKFGVSACLSRNRSLLDIPHISLIANRYIEPATAKELFVLNPLEICKFINLAMPQFPLYEFVPLVRPSFLKFAGPACSVSFWFRVPSPCPTEFKLLSAALLC
jgi:hypothetical protein